MPSLSASRSDSPHTVKWWDASAQLDILVQYFSTQSNACTPGTSAAKKPSGKSLRATSMVQKFEK